MRTRLSVFVLHFQQTAVRNTRISHHFLPVPVLYEKPYLCDVNINIIRLYRLNQTMRSYFVIIIALEFSLFPAWSNHGDHLKSLHYAPFWSDVFNIGYWVWELKMINCLISFIYYVWVARIVGYGKWLFKKNLFAILYRPIWHCYSTFVYFFAFTIC